MRMNRKKPGKKLENGVSSVRRVNLTLDVTTIAILEAAGAENLSAGVRHAARCWYAEMLAGRAKAVDGALPPA